MKIKFGNFELDILSDEPIMFYGLVTIIALAALAILSN